MFGKTGYWLVGLLLLISVVIRSGLLFFFALALLLAAIASWVWERYSLERVEYRRWFTPARAFFGEQVDFTVEVVNRKALPLAWLQVEDEIPRQLEPVKGRSTPTYKPDRSNLTNLLSLRWYERVRRHFQIRCDVRGYHAFGPVELRSGDMFGFSSRQSTLPGQDYLLVYPKVVPISQLGLPSKEPFGDMKARQWIFEDPLRTVGVRDYVYGDSPRRIDWKATARTQELQVRVYEPTTTYRLVVMLNLNTYGSYWWQGFVADLLELAIVAAASVANWAIEQGYQVGLYANAEMLVNDRTHERVRVTPSRDPEQLTQILEALAKVSPFTTMPLEHLLQLEARELPYGATIVVVSAVLSEESLSQLMTLKAAGHRIALLLIGDDVPDVPLDGIWTYRIGGEERWRELTEIDTGNRYGT